MLYSFNNNTRFKYSIYYFFIALFICLICNYLIFSEYAFLDTYEFIYTSSRDPKVLDIFIENGRPLLGLWCKWMYSSAMIISNLKFFRFFSLLLCVLFSTQAFYFLIKKGLKVFESSLFSLLILALPCFSIYMAWTTVIQIPIVIVICFFAGQLLLKEFNNKKTLSIKVCVAFLLVFIAMFFYQSAITILIVPFVIQTIITKDFKINIALKFIVFTAIIYILYFIAFKLMLINLDLSAASRTSPSFIEIPKKIIKFYLIELRTLVANSGFLILPYISLSVGLISFLGFFIKKLINKASFIFIGFLVFVLAYGYSPNILSGQDYFSIRTIATSSVLVLFFQFWFIRDLCIEGKLPKLIAFLIPLILLFFASHNQTNYLAGLQIKEYSILKKEFLSIDISKTKKVQVIIPKHDFLQTNNYYPNGSTDEFGRLSSARDWAVKHLFCQLHWETLKSNNNTISISDPKNVIVIEDKDQSINEAIPIINLKDIFHESFKRD